MGNLYFATSILGGVDGSLKDIDTQDSLGDGSGKLLAVGDTAVVVGYESKIIFYKLKGDGPQADSGIDIVAPRFNPGTLYWDCQGYTNADFKSINDTHDWPIKAYPPNGATLVEGTFDNRGPELWLDPTATFPGESISYHGSGCHDGYYYLMYDFVMKFNIAEGSVVSLGDVSGGNHIGFSDYPAYCEDIGYVFDIVAADGKVYVFNMTNETYSERVWDATEFISRHGSDHTYWGTGLGSMVYLFGGAESTVKTKAATQYNPIADVFTAVSDLPSSMESPALAANPTDKKILITNPIDGTSYIYDAVLDTYESIAVAPSDVNKGKVTGGYINGVYVFYGDTRLCSYDPILDSWTEHKFYSGYDTLIGDPQVYGIFDTEYGLIAEGGDAVGTRILRVPPKLMDFITT
ncbi:MAG: hypothetical protein GWN00_01355 [Aliifodinibius sp.]|nr:hypothetical protein [Fodinibius sp.]NIV09979.1 hypothetical protein [Fodinibius sp.]NIY23509.1 hypothetical protein [Fodinibius sp.]